MAFDWRTLLSALSSAAPILSDARANRRQQSALMQGELEAANAQAQADKRLGDEVTKLEQSGPQPERQQSLAGYAQALKRARAQTTGPNLGGDRYQAQLKDANAATASYGRRQGDYMAQIDAAGLQRQREGQSFTRAADDASIASRRADTAQYLARLRAQRIQPNPWVRLLAGIGQNVARNYEPRPKPMVNPDEVIDFPPLGDSRYA